VGCSAIFAQGAAIRNVAESYICDRMNADGEAEAEVNLSDMTNDEVLEAWDVVEDMDERDHILEELQRRRLFPSEETDAYRSVIEDFEDGAGAYPDAGIYKDDRGQFQARDPTFLQKLLARREFAESLQTGWESDKDPCSNLGFEVTPVQRFVANFLSPRTPFQSALLFHGTGVGKTCAAVQIAENWLREYPRNKVIIVAPRAIQDGFRATIFDVAKVQLGDAEGEPNRAVQCTQDTYMELTNTLYERDKEVIKRRTNEAINRRYSFFGYLKFANYIEGLLARIPKILSAEQRRAREYEIITREFDGRLLIIDEAHNLRESGPVPTREEVAASPAAAEEAADEDADSPGGKSDEDDNAGGKRLTPFLDKVLTYTTGMKLVLLTATPMYNSYREIIFLLNLLLKNDGQATLTERDIFHSDGSFRSQGERLLGLVAARYISFMRGENPQSFPLRLKPADARPIRLYPSQNPRGADVDLEETVFAEHLPIVPTYLTGDSLEAVRVLSGMLAEGEGGISSFELQNITQAGSLIVPPTDLHGDDPESLKARTESDALLLHFSKQQTGGEVQYSALEEGGAAWLGADEIETYSPKYARLLGYLTRAEGVCFVYTRFVQSGAVPIALMLEANGYTPYGRRQGLLGDGIQTAGGRQCALCSAREAAHKGAGAGAAAAAADHEFVPAKYALLTGDLALSPRNEAVIRAEKQPENKDGGVIKVVIGSQVAAEGVDLKFVREVHVMESWFHLNKTEQIVGRGIRYCSHSLLPVEKRNTTIYLHCSLRPDEDDVESGDLYSYRVAFRKGQQVGRVTRVLKQYAVDCNLNHDAIIIQGTQPRLVVDSQGNERRDVTADDQPFTVLCDWMETCDYQCAPEIPVDPLTASQVSYDAYSSRWREHILKERLRGLFKTQMFVSLEHLKRDVLGDAPFVALVDLLYNIVGNRRFTVNHRGRDGYIIYKNGYYIFQPFNLLDVSVPIALRVARLPVKRESYEPAISMRKPTLQMALAAAAAKPAAVVVTEDVAAVVTEDDSEEAAAAAADAAAAVPGKSVADLTGIWTAFEEWVDDWVRADQRDRAITRIPDAIVLYIQDRAAGNKKERDRLTYQFEMVSWFAIGCMPWTADSRAAFKRAVMEYVWDEEFTDADRSVMLADKERMPASMLAQAGDHYLQINRTGGAIHITRAINAAHAAPEFICDGVPCDASIIKLIEPDAKGRKTMQQVQLDPLNTLTVNKDTTGPLYGFVTTEKGGYVFKTSVPPAKGEKVKIGEKCANVSNVQGHLAKLVLLGNALRAAGEHDLELRKEVMEGTRKIVSSVRICMLMDLVLRYLDARRFGGVRWFYRPLAAFKVGHKGKK
jgi:hypothetical protein